jgi:hypothetical protein
MKYPTKRQERIWYEAVATYPDVLSRKRIAQLATFIGGRKRENYCLRIVSHLLFIVSLGKARLILSAATM